MSGRVTTDAGTVKRMAGPLPGSGRVMKRYPLAVRVSVGAVLVVTAAACGGGSSGSSGSASPSAPQNAPTQISGQDQAWAKAAHQGDLAEIAAGKMAQHKGTTPQIKDVGKMLVTDHTRLDHALMKSLGATTQAMPTQPSAAQQATAKELAAKHGAAFDGSFVTSQIAAHKKTIAATKKEAADGRSPKVRAAAHAALPVLTKHLSRLQKLQGD